MQLACHLHTNDIRQTHHGRVTEHDVFGFKSAHAYGDNTKGIHHGGVAVSTHTGVRESHAIAHLYHRRHFLQVDLVHDAIARRDHIHVIEGSFGPVDEMEPVLVATLFHRAVLLECALFKTGMLHSQGVVNDKLGRHHRVHLGRITALLGDGITQAGQVYQRGLAKNVMADNAGRVPGKVQVAFALDELLERIGQILRRTAAHQLLCQNSGSVWKFCIGPRLDRIDRRTGVEIVQLGAGKGFAVFGVHSLGISCLGA